MHGTLMKPLPVLVGGVGDALAHVEVAVAARLREEDLQ